MQKKNLIQALNGTQMSTVKLVDEQSVPDIISGIKMKHRQCVGMYDKIDRFFPSDNLEDLCFDLWEFCRDNLQYQEETVEDQFVSSPTEILERGYSDCKGYALFCAGVLDAKKRKGLKCKWVFRFVPSRMLSTDIGHVFVVVNPATDNIWIDPVLGSFDNHYPYFVKKDEVVNTQIKRVGAIGGLQPLINSGRKIGSAEDDLLGQIKAYSDGIVSSMQQSQQSGTLNTINAGMLSGISTAIPGASAAIALVKNGAALISNAFGPGSLAARLASQLATNPLMFPINAIKQIFNGRTYNSDQYAGAQMYQYNVLGNPNMDTNKIADSDVIPALKWFIDRLGVFISGRQHINALIQSPQAYIALHGVNPDTDTDMAKVGPASAVAKQYFYQTGSQPPGLWANTVGVFDPTLIALAQRMGESVEQVSNQVNQGVIPDPRPSASPVNQILSSPVLWIGGAVALGLLLTSSTSKSGKSK